MARLTHLHRDERGVSLVFVCLGLTSFLAATTVAIDVGMFMTARNQAQNAADAGALAGAVALVQNSYTDRSGSGPVVRSALLTGRSNTVLNANVDIQTGDVTFPAGPGGVNNRVRVQVHRTTARNNPVQTLMGRYFGVPTVDIIAAATAEASPANAATCVKPFTVPDRWIEKQTPPWDADDTFDLFDKKGKPLAKPDVYIPAQHADYTGYDAARDRGIRVALKANNTTNVAPSFYNPWRMPGSTGASDYSANISGCNTAVVPIGAPMEPEPGNMVGPTEEGTANLIAKDLDAYWDTGCKCVKGSKFAKSPRVAVIPLYDPVYYVEGKQNSSNATLKVANYLGFFIEELRAGEVIGRITPISGILDGSAGPAPQGAFPKVIRLVQ